MEQVKEKQGVYHKAVEDVQIVKIRVVRQKHWDQLSRPELFPRSEKREIPVDAEIVGHHSDWIVLRYPNGDLYRLPTFEYMERVRGLDFMRGLDADGYRREAEALIGSVPQLFVE